MLRRASLPPLFPLAPARLSYVPQSPSQSTLIAMSLTLSYTQLYTPPADGHAWVPDEAFQGPRPNQAPNLRVALGGQQLRPFVHNGLQRAVLALPGRDVLVVRGAITLAQVQSHRQSYINALLIQSRGALATPPCRECSTRADMAGDGRTRPFPECRRLAGHFGGCCANCKWRDHAARCPFSGLDNGNASGPPPPRPGPGGGAGRGSGRGQGRGGLPVPGGSQGNPIVL